ncbi:MAG: SDR family NAD(P)-dependent oxidoreductase [Gammaproteobacteria bacterium]
MNVMIIGGTSGIGLALARHYLGQGARVGICGRDLTRVDPALRQQAALHAFEFDIADRAAVTTAVDAFATGGLDLLIVSAGCYADAAALAADPALGLRMQATNVHGLTHSFDAGAAAMRARGTGRLVAIASIAGLIRDYPGGSLYSANKRAVIALCDVYRKTLAPFGIGVTVVVPGYVDTARLRELNGGDARAKPILMSEETAVRHISTAIEAGKAVHVFPWQLHALVRLFNAMPLGLRRLRRK